MVDLLIKQVTEGLSPDEQRALDVMDSAVASAALRDLERAAAAVTLAGSAPTQPLPRPWRSAWRSGAMIILPRSGAGGQPADLARRAPRRAGAANRNVAAAPIGMVGGRGVFGTGCFRHGNRSPPPAPPVVRYRPPAPA